jgi:DNA-binding NarL/FixJ family response regulator
LRNDLRVIIGHGHAHVREGLRQILLEEGAAEAIKEVASVEELTAALKEGCWNVVVLGTSFADSALKEHLETIRRADPAILRVVLSSYPQAAVSALFMGCGADAVVMEERIDEDLLATLERLRRGEYVACRGLEEDSSRVKAASGEKPSVSALSSADHLKVNNTPSRTVPPVSH